MMIRDCWWFRNPANQLEDILCFIRFRVEQVVSRISEPSTVLKEQQEIVEQVSYFCKRYNSNDDMISTHEWDNANSERQWDTERLKQPIGKDRSQIESFPPGVDSLFLYGKTLRSERWKSMAMASAIAWEALAIPCSVADCNCAEADWKASKGVTSWNTRFWFSGDIRCFSMIFCAKKLWHQKCHPIQSFFAMISMISLQNLCFFYKLKTNPGF